MSRMPWPVRVMDRVDQVLVWLSQALLAAMVGITFVSVVGRSFSAARSPMICCFRKC